MALAVLLGFAPAEAQEPVPGELLVRLAPGPGAPTPEALAMATRHRQPVPGGLGLGDPLAAEPLLHERAGQRFAARVAADPDSPRARLERYVVLRYPPVVDLDALMQALERNPHVEAVQRNEYVEVSVVPNDPLMTASVSPVTPDQYQWGTYSLGLTDAWDLSTGHGYLGIVDLGIDVDHEDLRGLYQSGSTWVWDGGNFRPNLSRDYGYDEDDVDEGQTQNGQTVTGGAGHGTHVAGIAAAHADNGKGVAGACWNCSLMIAKISTLCSNGSNQCATVGDVAEGITGMVDRGAQAINLSLGYRSLPNCSTNPLCDAVDLADRRDVVISAAAGNDGTTLADWPSTDSRAIGVGGIQYDESFWNDCPGFQCGSNSDPDQIVAPAKTILSTFYIGISYSPSNNCDDSLLPGYTGYGPCTGTSMSAPYVTGSVGLLRSLNPILDKADVRSLLVSNLEVPAGWNPADGLGKPNIRQAAEDALGSAGGSPLGNRLTPLFRMWSYPAEDSFYTTFPQWAAARYWGDLTSYYVNQGRGVGWYSHFPGTQCQVGPCSAGPAADVFVFTTDKSPNGHPLVPLYRLSYVGATAGNPDNRDHVYTTEDAGILAYAGVGYELDGIEGYIYGRCTPEPGCIPSGAVRLYRYYNPSLDDHALFPETDLATYTAQGYGPESGANPWIGYVYLNQDSDFDDLIDGFEGLLGTHPADNDSDCDGVYDGTEVNQFPYGDPLGAPGCSSPIGEVGQVTNLTHVAQTVTFSRSYSDPVVFAQSVSYTGGQPAVVRIRNVASGSFTMALEEPPDLDGTHTTETVSWVVLEGGSWQLPNGAELEVGHVDMNNTVGTNVAGSFRTVTFSQAFGAAPAVLTQVQSDNDPSFVKTRQQLATASSVKFAMEEEEASATLHGTESVGWMALSKGSGTWSGRRYDSGVSSSTVTDAFTALSFAGSAGFTSAPRLLTGMATRAGGNNAEIRYTALTSAGFQAKVEEDTTYDAEVAHIGEGVSYLAIEGSGSLDASPR